MKITSSTKQHPTTPTPAWADGYGRPTPNQVDDANSLLFVPADQQADYWATAADPAAVRQLLRRAGVHVDPQNRATEITAWALSKGLVPDIDTRFQAPQSLDSLAYTTLTRVDRDYGLTEQGLLDHIVVARYAAETAKRRVASAQQDAWFDDRHRCACCGTPDATTRKRMRSAPHYPNGTPAKIVVEPTCERCYAQALAILAEQASNRAQVTAWLGTP